ncbi:MAG: elongation factor Ts [Bacteroidetes bacterium]|nr:MAG: elongation factor Ts [Bacteroidota bacterium]
MTITAQDVNKLRQVTGAGMMDCKKALTEANGNFEEAITILRKKGQKVSANRADRETSEGAVFIHINDNATQGIIFSLGCETDFVGKNEDFLSLGKTILNAAVANNPANAEALNALHVDGRPISDHIVDFVGKIGEKIEVVRYESINAEKVFSYTHSNNKLGVLIGLNGINGADTTELGKDLAMQIASMKPLAVDKDGVDASVVEREIEIGKEQARQEGKPEAMLEKIALGKLNKFYQENTLLAQEYVKDNSLTIQQLIEKTGKTITVPAFYRVSLG